VLPADLLGRHLCLLYTVQSDQQSNMCFNKSMKVRPQF